MAASRSIAEVTSGVAGEWRQVWRSSASRASCLIAFVLGLLGPLATAETLTPDALGHETANVFTPVNVAVLLGLVFGVLGTTGEARLSTPPGPRLRRTIATKASAYGLAGVAAVVVLAVLAAAIGIPIIHGKGLASPASRTVLEYLQREAVAVLCLAPVGVAIGLVAGGRRRGLVGLVSFLVGEAVAAAHVPLIRDYGPIGALNAFSDASHHHHLSTATGAIITLTWAVAALFAATCVAERRAERDPAAGDTRTQQ